MPSATSARQAALIEEAIAAARDEDFLLALTLFLDVYRPDEKSRRTPKEGKGLSYFGLSLALVRKEMKPAIELCRRAIELEFYNGDHYANLARVYAVAGNRKKAIETAEKGLKLAPDHDYLLAVRHSFGVRSDPYVPFLTRRNPINVSLFACRACPRKNESRSRKSGPALCCAHENQPQSLGRLERQPQGGEGPHLHR